MNRITVLGFMDEMSKIANGDMMQYFMDHPEKLKEKQKRDAAKKAKKKSKNSTEHRWAKEKKSGFMANVGNRISRSVVGAGKQVGGALKEMATHPVRGMKEGLKATAHDFKTGNKALTALGIGATALGINDLRKKKDPSGAGNSKLHRTAKFIGSEAGGIIGAPFGIPGSIAGSVAGEQVGNLAGKAVDKIRGYKRTPAMVQGAPVSG